MISFTEFNVEQIIAEASKISRVNVEPAEFLKDMCESVCLLIKDGLRLTFSHRTFQEYFSANFIKNSDSETKVKVFSALMAAGGFGKSEHVLGLLFEIDKGFVEDHLIIPGAESIFEDKDFEENDPVKISVKYLIKLYTSVNVEQGSIKSITWKRDSSDDNRYLNFLRLVYWDRLEKIKETNPEYFISSSKDKVWKFVGTKELSSFSSEEIVEIAGMRWINSGNIFAWRKILEGVRDDRSSAGNAVDRLLDILKRP